MDIMLSWCWLEQSESVGVFGIVSVSVNNVGEAIRCR